MSGPLGPRASRPLRERVKRLVYTSHPPNPTENYYVHERVYIWNR